MVHIRRIPQRSRDGGNGDIQPLCNVFDGGGLIHLESFSKSKAKG
jgi:hypothetical protein